MKFFLSLLLFMFSTQVFATSFIGTIKSVKGSVKVKHHNSISKNRVKSGMGILAGDLLTSSKNASVEIKLTDNSLVLLDELSTLHFSSLYEATQTSGKVLYKITSRDAKNSLKIKTPFAVIGIKGTTFIVNSTQTQSVMLKKGLIGIRSINEKFELYRQRMDNEFNSFKAKGDVAMQQQLNDFEKFKKMQQKELYEAPISTKEFDLSAGNSVSFDGKKVKEQAFTSEAKKEFSHFDSLLQDMR